MIQRRVAYLQTAKQHRGAAHPWGAPRMCLAECYMRYLADRTKAALAGTDPAFSGFMAFEDSMDDGVVQMCPAATSTVDSYQ